MRLLVLGGTKFLGRAVVEAALARGDEVTLFNRGQTGTELFPEVEKLRGDRDGDLAALEGREWDAVIDPSGYVPRIVRDSAELLRGSVGHYVFVSSGSVYADPYPGFDETAPTAELEDPDTEEVMAHYGALKAACERVVSEVFPDAHTNVRAGLIVGPNDPTGRFTYWPLRVAVGGELLAPAPPERSVQFIDVRDLGEWMVEACDKGHVGTFNATGEQLRFDEFLAACGDADPVWVSDEFLRRARGRALQRAAALDPGGACRLPPGGRLEGRRRRASLPPARRDDPRHARVGRRGGRAAGHRPRPTPGPSRPRPRQGGRAARSLARTLSGHPHAAAQSSRRLHRLSNRLLLAPDRRPDAAEVGDDRLRRANAKGNVQEQICGRLKPRTRAMLAHEGSHLLVARTPHAEALGGGTDAPRDLGRASREPSARRSISARRRLEMRGAKSTPQPCLTRRNGSAPTRCLFDLVTDCY